MTRLFMGSVAAGSGKPLIEIWAARNEYESVQLLLTDSNNAGITSIDFGDLKHIGGDSIYKAGNCLARAPEYVYVERNTSRTPANELDGKAPGWYPDPLPLFTENSRKVVNSVWVSCYIPDGTRGGTYRGEASLTVGTSAYKIPVRLHVWSFALPKKPGLHVSMWTHVPQIVKRYNTKKGSRKFWQVVEAIAQDQSKHRVDISFVYLSLIKTTKDEMGKYRFDFTDYERWIEIFRKQGIENFEGYPLAHAKAHNIYDVASGEKIKILAGDDLTYEDKRYLRSILNAINEENRKLKLQGHYMQHVGDEMRGSQVRIYREIAEIVREEMPDVPIIDATHLSASDRKGMMDIPVTNMVAPLSKERNGIGKKWGRWWYTAGFKPRGRMPNRFIDYPLIKMRIIPWLNWRMGVSGYLHYAYNFWYGPSGESPWHRVQYGKYPPGDAWVVYPRRDGDKEILVPSMRWEVFRDGLEDYEYLKLMESWKIRLLADEVEGSVQRDMLRKKLEELEITVKGEIRSRKVYTRDPMRLEDVRKRIGLLLDQLEVEFSYRE
ncbi:DUF4091 domain-containing protein [Thiogranum longum]|nr:DUF4091 domain-containing protein [Thiogranum longum]